MRFNLSVAVLLAIVGLSLAFDIFETVLPSLERLKNALTSTSSSDGSVISDPLNEQDSKTSLLHAKTKRPIHGRFLHITDIHPDPYYKPHTSPETACHRDEDEEGETGPFGHPVSRCDAPMSLVNATFEWIEANLKDKIDFVVWTGDNVRHDRDNKFPRTEMHILDMNERMVKKFEDVFGCDDPFHPLEIPIVPSLGNNDVYPHNLFVQGPTLQTRELYRIWSKMVPEEQVHVFDRGVSFMAEVIPNKLAVLSINTLYWFQSNPITDGCDKRKDPGHLQFRWLGIVLSELRARGMKVWLTGHVPPTANNWEPSCLDRYSAWFHEYRDIIVGSLFGHMNVDHFLVLDSQAVTPEKIQSAPVIAWDDENPITVQGKVEYLADVRETYNEIVDPEDGSLNTRYSIHHVNPSVIPTYLPGLRVWEYNITGLEDLSPSVYANGEPLRSWAEVFEEIDQELARLLEDDDYPEEYLEEDTVDASGKKKKKKPKADPTWPPKFESVLPGPAYKAQTFTPTRYTQYFSNLTAANIGDKNITYELEYSTDDAPYYMDNLLVESWIKLARYLSAEIAVSPSSSDDTHDSMLDQAIEGSEAVLKKSRKKGKKGHKKNKKEDHIIRESRKAWKTYLKRAFVSSGFENLDD